MKWNILRTLLWVALLVPTLAGAQAYPTKSVKVIVPYAAGGNTGVDAYGSTPAEFANTIRKDFEMYRDAAKAIGITPG